MEKNMQVLKKTIKVENNTIAFNELEKFNNKYVEVIVLLTEPKVLDGNIKSKLSQYKGIINSQFKKG